MPRIPTYVSSNQLTKDAPNRLVDAASFQVNDNTGEILSEQGKAIQSAAAQMERVRDISENTSAQTAAAKGFSEIHLEAIESPDIWNAGKTAQDKISKLRGELSSKITSDIARAQFEAAFDTDAMNYTNKINSTLRERQALTAVNSLLDYEASKESEFVNAGSPYDRQLILNQLNEKYTDFVRSGVIRPEKAAAAFKEAKERLINGYAENYTYTYPGIALEELSAGDKGMFKDISEDKRLELEKTAKALIEKTNQENEMALRKSQSEEMGRLIKAKIGGAPAAQLINEVKNSLDEGMLEPKDADMLIRSLTATKEYKPDSLESITKYNELVERNASLKKKEKAWFGGGKASFEEIAKFRADAIKAEIDGYVSKTQMEELLGDTANTFYRDPVFRNALKNLASQSKLYATPESQAKAKAEMYSSLMRKVMEGTEPRQAVTEVITERVSGEVSSAVNRGEIKDKRIVAIIDDLRKKKVSDSDIAKNMRGKGLDPELYGVKE